MIEPTFAQLRSVTIGLLDKCHQLESLLDRFHHIAGVEESLANLRAYRHTLRGYLTTIRDYERSNRVAVDEQTAAHGDVR